MPALENPRHERFCQEYVIDLNQTQAYVRAGYAAKNADANACRLMGDERVLARIAELKTERGKALAITQDSVVLDLVMLRENARGAGNFGPAVKAAELIGKHIGMWPTKIDVQGSIALGDLVKRAHRK